MPPVPPLLRLFARPMLTPAEVAADPHVRDASAAAWAELAAAAVATGVGGLVHRNVTRFSADAALAASYATFSTADAAALRDAYVSTLADNLRRLHAADAVIAALLARGIEVLILKGGALVETHYGDPGLRPMGDIDLLVRAPRMGEASVVVESLGYRRLQTPGREVSEDLHYQRPFLSGKEVVELHVALCDARRYPIDIDELWARSRAVRWRGKDARVLCDADHVAYVALHAALHGYILPFTCLADVSLLLRRATDSAAVAAEAAERARAWRAGTAVYETLSLARALAGAPVPDDVLASLRPDPLRALYLRFCLPESRWPPFRFGRSLRVAQALTLLPLMDGGRAEYLAHYAKLRLADLAR